MLLDRGADPNTRTKETPPIRRQMLRVTGSLAWVDFTGQTPFLTASLSGDLAVMRLLLEYGADPYIPTLRRHDGADGGGRRQLGGRPDARRGAEGAARRREALRGRPRHGRQRA